MNSKPPVIYLMGCASPYVLDMIDLVRDMRELSANVCVLLTPSAALWLKDDIEQIAEITGFPVRVDYKLPMDPDVLPNPDIMVVAPATFKTINKWALGISDTLILGLLNEWLGMDILKIAIPALTYMLARHPQWEKSINLLSNTGVHLLGNDKLPWNEYSLIDKAHFHYAWNQTLELVKTHIHSANQSERREDAFS